MEGLVGWCWAWRRLGSVREGRRLLYERVGEGERVSVMRGAKADHVIPDFEDTIGGG